MLEIHLLLILSISEAAFHGQRLLTPRGMQYSKKPVLWRRFSLFFILFY